MKSITKKQWILAAIMLVVVTASTALLRLNITFQETSVIGYWTLGDAAVYISAALLGGPLGALVAAIGSALADLFAGHSVYALGSLVIKGVMALLFAWYARKGHTFMHLIKAVCLCSGWMVAAYFLYDLIFRGNYLYAAFSLPFNMLQALASGLIATVILFFVGGKTYRSGEGFHKPKDSDSAQSKRTLK